MDEKLEIRKKRRKTDRLINLSLVGIMLIGLAIMGYPSFADWWNSLHQARAVASYMSTVAKMDTKDYDRMIEEAETYNEALSQVGMLWSMSDEQRDEYYNILDVTGTGIMAYLDIPKIQVTLPIYHGTGEDVLQVAIGHIEGSSLPVGGEGSHCVISGHRGLPSARLLTDLDKLAEGDTFTISVMNRTLTYEVDQIRTVEPTDLSELKITEGKDYCTLVTCTPYGINTHRLLVRGHRIENARGEANVIADAMQLRPVFVAPIVAIPMLFIALIWTLFTTRKKKNS